MDERGYWFVSHCSKDIKIVDQIIDVLKQCGISYWKAPEMIPAGSNYAKEIPKALKNCSVFLFVVSEASQNSIWVEKELDSAVNARKNIIPVRIDDTPLNDMYTFYLNNVQMVDIHLKTDGKIEKDSLEKLAAKFKESAPQKTIVIETVQENAKVTVAVDRKEHRDIIDKVDLQEEMQRRRLDNRTNAFRINKIPIFCERCGAKLECVSAGTYRCPACNVDYYDDFMKIKNFIKDNGPAPAITIARNTGVSKQAIECYFRDDVTISPKDGDFIQNRVTKTERRLSKDIEGKWHSSIWKR